MEELCFSIDEERYDDRHGHILSLDGWYIHPEKKECGFVLLGDGYEKIDLPEIEHRERPDVLTALNTDCGEVLPGFTVHIPEVLKLMEKFGDLELFLTEGDNRISIWSINAEDLHELVKESLVEFHLDRIEVLYGTMLEIQGWAVDQRGSVEVTVHKEDASLLDCRITRGRRPDVVERRGLDDVYRSQEIGFRISAALPEIPGKKIILHFCGDSVTKTYDIDVETLRKEQKPKGFFHRLFHKEPEKTDDYEQWILKHRPDKKTLRKQKKTVFQKKPLISIVIPLYQTPEPYLRELIDSVKAQSYENWQLCLADGSPDDRLKGFLDRNYGKENRIVYRKLEQNGGISANTNEAVALATGEYLMLCDHDDTLEPDALYEIIKAINEKDNPDVLYTDEDKVSMDGKHYFDPNFKPDYNLFRLRENNYICHIFVVKKALTDRVGLLRTEFDGAQDYDFIFRCCEEADKVVHIPKVLYHWRCHMDSTAADPESKAYAYQAGRRAIKEHYQRMGIDASVEMTERPGWYRSYVKIQDNPKISIIIPNKDHIDDLELCLFSLTKRSTYKNYEILIVENNSEKPETFEYYKKLPDRYPKVKVLTWDKEFNYSAINNFAAKQAEGIYLLFLNNDVEILTPQWMEEMLQICQQKDVAITGAKLYYPDDTIQHAGVVLGLGGIAGHIMCKASREDPGYFGRTVTVQEISAVTAACMMIRTEDFWNAGGFDETFQVAFNDIDLCMKVRAAGKKIVFTPYAELYHYESKSRGLEDTPEKQFRFDKEVKAFEAKWSEQLAKGDPYYSPNLSVTEGDCSLRVD
nr:glycosyltransferase family 2 protein [uncultured Blautia sp.]